MSSNAWLSALLGGAAAWGILALLGWGAWTLWSMLSGMM